MAKGTGMPMVTVPIPELAPYVEHGVSISMSDDEAELRGAAEALLDSAELAREVGHRGREVVRSHFGIDRFVDQWNALFEEVASR